MSFNGYNLLAPYYQFLVKLVYGDLLFTAQTYYLKRLSSTDRHPKIILIIGGGTGQLLLFCLKKFPDARICCVELSEGMVKITKTKLNLNDTARIDFYIEDILTWSSSIKFDFVLIPFVLDLLIEKDRKHLLKIASKNLSASGKILVTDFRKGNGIFQSLLIGFMYWSFRILNATQNNSLPEYEALFASTQLSIEREKRFGKRLLNELVVSYELTPCNTK